MVHLIGGEKMSLRDKVQHHCVLTLATISWRGEF